MIKIINTTVPFTWVLYALGWHFFLKALGTAQTTHLDTFFLLYYIFVTISVLWGLCYSLHEKMWLWVVGFILFGVIPELIILPGWVADCVNYISLL